MARLHAAPNLPAAVILLTPKTVPSLNLRNRMVVFRLTQEEYASLRDACKARGGRNLSEFTRSELLDMLRSESTASVIQKRFTELEHRLMQFEVAVAQLTDLLSCGAQAAATPLRRRSPGGTD